MIEISDVRPSTVLYIYTERSSIDVDPPYQRLGDVWTLEKKQLLVDSIINGYDIPKLYFHKFSKGEKRGGKLVRNAIIDGKQRLEAIWEFIDGKFPLSDDFEYIKDPSVKPNGLTYAELGRKYPNLKLQFDSYPLSIVAVEVDDLELIEDMFSRLNEAVPLSAAEKRNAFGGQIPPAIRRLAKQRFFHSLLPFTNSRYRHFDLAVKFLFIEYREDIVDTKKVYLDEFVRDWRDAKKGRPTQLERRVRSRLKECERIFSEKDTLLRSVGNVVLYYHLLRISMRDNWVCKVSRDKLMEFEERRRKNREVAESDLARADYDLLEFDRYVQTPNDAYATELRLRVLLKKAFDVELRESFEFRVD